MTVTAYFGGHMLAQALASVPDARVHIPYPFLLQIARAAVAAGVWASPAGVPVEDALGAFAAGMRFHPEGDTVLCDGTDTELQRTEIMVYRDELRDGAAAAKAAWDARGGVPVHPRFAARNEQGPGIAAEAPSGA